MTDEKYYTPEISEFHVGFEYEESCRQPLIDGEINSWRKRIFLVQKGLLSDVARTLSGNGHKFDIFYEDGGKAWIADGRGIRVKRLDHDDIIAAGWKVDVEKESIGYIHSNADIVIRPFIGSTLVQVLKFGGQIFFGSIRNASELKVLMRQLNIKP